MASFEKRNHATHAESKFLTWGSIPIASAFLIVSSLALNVHGAENNEFRPGELRQVPQAWQTPQQIEHGNITKPKPDLTIQDIQINPHAPKEGSSVTISANVINIGLKPLHWAQATIRVGGDPNGTVHSVANLDPNDVQPISRTMTMTQAGNFRVTVIVDHTNSVQESNENNNEKYRDFHIKKR